MLASERDGEVVAAARAIMRKLKAPREISCASKKSRRGIQSAIAHCRPFAAIAAVASVVATYRKCPPIQRLSVLAGSAAAPEFAVVPIKSTFLALRRVP